MSAPAAPGALTEDLDRSHLGPITRSEGSKWLLICVVGFVLGQAMAFLLAEIAAAIAGTPGGAAAVAKLASPPVWFVTVELVGLWIGFGTAGYIASRTRTIGLRFKPIDALFVFVGLALQGALTLIYTPFHLEHLDKPTNTLLGGGNGWLLVIPGLLVTLCAPFFEEIFFRGVMLRGLLAVLATPMKWIGITIAVLIDGGLFGLAHLGNDGWVQVPGLVFVGVVLALIALFTKRLGPGIVTHAAFNASVVIAYAFTR